MNKLIIYIVNFTFTSKEKAFFAFWVSGVGSYLTTNGLTYKDLLHWSTLLSVLVAVATHRVVYWTSNSSQGQA